MKYSYVVPGGAGYQGTELVRDLLFTRKGPRYDTKMVSVVDSRQEALDALADRMRDPRLRTVNENASDMVFMSGFVEGADVIFSCLPDYRYNLALTELAVEKGKHLVELGGNNDLVAEQKKLHKAAQKSGSRIIYGAGIAPGAITLVGQQCIDELGGPRCVAYLHMYCGGLPTEPQGLLNYKEVFSKKGWFNEIREPCDILRDGKRVRLEPMTEMETQEFYRPFGNLEAVHTSGGISSLVGRYEGKIGEMYYKTLRYPGHWAIMKALNDLGYLSDELTVDGVSASQMSEHVLHPHINYESNDVILARWVAGSGYRPGRSLEIEYNLIILGKPGEGRTAMQIATADSASIVGQMAAKGTIEQTGVIDHEDIPARKFLRQWAMRGIRLVRQERKRL
ncbi:saccharopine dehydrogenase NADP-binding domain-containing protein [Candidatus Woesearchaeota archaeon]|nr:saccharopine dehydrogenase NADP-binding domain-containing protein [Candidatus Woesearchaeota archaeon]